MSHRHYHSWTEGIWETSDHTAQKPLEWCSRAQNSLRPHVLHCAKRFCQPVGSPASLNWQNAAASAVSKASLQGAVPETSWKLQTGWFFAYLLRSVYMSGRTSWTCFHCSKAVEQGTYGCHPYQGQIFNIHWTIRTDCKGLGQFATSSLIGWSQSVLKAAGLAQLSQKLEVLKLEIQPAPMGRRWAQVWLKKIKKHDFL